MPFHTPPLLAQHFPLDVSEDSLILWAVKAIATWHRSLPHPALQGKDLPSFSAILVWPDPTSTGREDAIRIQSIF